MSVIMFTVDGVPVPWARARKRGKVHFTDPRVLRYRDEIKSCAVEAMLGEEPISGPVRLSFTAVMPIPSSFPDWKRQAAIAGVVLPTAKPDLDNLEKQLADSANKIIWQDDCQVCVGDTRKIYGTEPRLEVRIEPLPTITSAKEWSEHASARTGH